jgi:hypothetical protein
LRERGRGSSSFFFGPRFQTANKKKEDPHPTFSRKREKARREERRV